MRHAASHGQAEPRPNPSGIPQPAFDPVSLARRFPREALALVLLGIGGLLLPFPLWLLGAAVALTSTVWSRKDKLVGLVGPPVLTVVGIGVIGALNKNPSIAIDLHAYFAASHADAGILIRIGAILGAGYLGARLVRHDRPAATDRSADG